MHNTGTMQSQSARLPISTADISEMYANNYRWLVSALNKKLSCSQTATDLAQDTFMRILASRKTFYITEAKALLTTIAKGLVVDHYRRQSIEAAYLDALLHMEKSQAPSPEDNALIVETLCEIDRMLDGLPVKARQIFLLSQLDELTYQEIARLLNISLSSVQKHMTKTYAACYAVLYWSQYQ